MRDQDLEPKFSWPLAFLITGLSFISFFYVFEKLNEPVPVIFLWIGIGALALAIGSAVGSLFTKPKQNSHHHRHIDQ